MCVHVMCGYVFTTLCLFYLFSRMAARFPCPFLNCRSVYRRPDYLFTHFEVKHRGLRYLCNTCNLLYTSEKGVRDHCFNEHQTQGRTAYRKEIVGRAYTNLNVHEYRADLPYAQAAIQQAIVGVLKFIC